MTPCSPSYGITLSRGQIETSTTQPTSLKNQLLRPLTRSKILRLLRIQQLLAVLFLAAIVGCDQKNYSNHVELVMGSSSPTPATTFELRFDSVMVKGEHVGLAATNSPLAIDPPLLGTFIWLSSRSGVFTPSEPLALDTTYELSLRPDLRCADGKACDATLRWTVVTPAFGVIATSPPQGNTNACSEPEIKLVFNADVRAAEVQPNLYFCDTSGRQIPADVRQGTSEEFWSRYEFGTFDSLQTWKQDVESVSRFPDKDHTSAQPEYPTNEVGNLLIVLPQRALPIGKGWKLVVPGGTIAANRTFRSRVKREVPVGDITPFVVEEVEACNYINAGASIRVKFSKPIPESLTNSFRDAIEFSLTPTNLDARVWGRQLVLSGSFQGGNYYMLKLRPGFASAEPFTLQGSNSFIVPMPHVEPRLYFPALSRDQMASANRSFPLLTINVARVRIRAKLMDAHSAIHALRGFTSYFASRQERENDWQEPYRAIDYNLLPGKTIFDKEFDLGVDSADSDAAKKLNLSWDELLKGRHAGVVFLDAQRVHDGQQDAALGSQALIQLTDLGMVWKKSQTGVDAFVFSQATGEPVGGATARLFGDENEPLFEAITDTNGLAHLDAATNADWIAVQREDDFHALTLDENRVWLYRFDLPFTGSNEREDTRRVMLFGDRDLYRPGEAMHLEAMARDWLSAGLSVPLGLTGTLQCVDARGNRFFQTNAALNSFGSWSTLVPLPMTPSGLYSARLRLGSNDYTYAFQVQDFQPNAFEMSLPCKDAYAANEAIALPLSARYLFGKNLSRAQVTWSLEASDTDFSPAKFQGFSFRRDDFESRYGRGRSSVSLSGRGVLTGTSNFVIAPTLPMNLLAPQPREVSMLAEVTDVNQQTLSHQVEFLKHSSDFYLGLRQGADVLTAETNLPLEIVAIGADGKPWPETVKAHLKLQRVDWQNVRVQGTGKTSRFRNEPVFTNILEREISVAPVSAPGSSDDQAKGNLLKGLPRLPAGEYLIEVKAEDSGGRPIASSLDLQVTAPAELGWNYRNDVQLTLKPDHKSYAPGETAEILIESPFTGTALVSIEREKVLRSFVTHLEGNAPSIRVPIEPGDVPNVFVSVTLARGSENSPHKIKEPEYRVGFCELPVVNVQNQLGVKITSAQTNYLPGAQVEVGVEVTDSAQQLVPCAEVVLYAVDDGILGLTDYALPDPYNFFYAARPLGVQSSVSLPNLLYEHPEDLLFQNKGYTAGGGGSDRIRKNFLACAFWNASLQTDAEGKVQARFTAPDSLTRYRLFAVVHTADSHFGSSQSAFHVTKPLVIDPALPSFANITDHLVARAVVLNQTKEFGTVVVTLELDDKAKASGPDVSLSRRVLIPANCSEPVEFPVEFTDTGEAKWVWKAHFAEGAAPGFTDGVQSTIEVGHIAPMLREVLLAHDTNSETNLLALANPQLLAGRGTITVNIANTRLNELEETASQLLHYPYGCAEQTGSSLLPWVVLRDAPGLLPLRIGTNDAASAIRAGIARLFSMQTQSGGLGYWPHAKEPMLWASAYGGMVLALAQRHGVTVPKEGFDPLLKYLSHELRSPSDNAADLSDGCLAVYALALAGRAEPAYQEKLYSVRGKLSAENRALLALAIAESHGPTEMIKDLLQASAAINSDNENRFGCDARTGAIRLLAWISFRPDDSIVDRLVDDLMRDQKDAHWRTTQGNAWGLLALTDYAKRVEIKRQPVDGHLSYAGESVSFQLDERTNVFTHVFAITNLAEARLLISKESTNRVYTSVSIEARPPEIAQPRQDRGFSLERTYERLDDDNQPRPLNGLQVGDRVLVTLHLSVRDWAKYMVIDDPLPSVLEAVNPEFRTQTARSAEAVTDDGNWWTSDFREIRKDRCLWFADSVAPGNYTLRYVARVRAAGTVTAPPAKAEEMYHPERCGFTESQILVSKGLE